MPKTKRSYESVSGLGSLTKDELAARMATVRAQLNESVEGRKLLEVYDRFLAAIDDLAERRGLKRSKS